jgi:hypothetical protein
VARYRRLYYDWQRAAVLLLLLAPLVMILPTALAVNEIVPSNLRALGLIPFVFFLPPIGLITLLRDVERRFGRPNLTVAVQVIVPAAAVGGGQWTQHQLLPRLGRRRGADLCQRRRHDGHRRPSRWTLADSPPDAPPTVYVASPHYRHPTLAFLSANYDAVKWLPGSHALVFPAAGEALYLLPGQQPRAGLGHPLWLEADSPPEIMLTERRAGVVPRLPPRAGASHFLECDAPSATSDSDSEEENVQRTSESAMHEECGPTGTFGGLLRLDGSTTLPDDVAQTGIAATPAARRCR